MKFRKEVIRVGEYFHPDASGGVLAITLDRIKKWIANFESAGIKVWLPIRHSKDPRDNAGWVTGLSLDGDKLMADMDVTDNPTAERIENGTITDVSIGLEFDFTDDKGNIFDEIIRHVALTVDPHIRMQEGFIAAEYKTNIELIRGGDTMSDDKLSLLDKVELALESKAAIKVELEAERGKVVELEAQLNTLKGRITELEGFEGKVKTLEAEATKAAADKLKVELEAAIDDGIKARKVIPAERELLLEAYTDVEKLKAAIDVRPVNKEINLEGAEIVENPNKDELVSETGKTVLKGLGLDPNDQKTAKQYSDALSKKAGDK